MTLYALEKPDRPRAALRWCGAAIVVTTLHLGAGWWLFGQSFGTAPPPDTVQGVAIDLEPIVVPQNAPEPNATTAAGTAPSAQAAIAPPTAAPVLPDAPAEPAQASVPADSLPPEPPVPVQPPEPPPAAMPLPAAKALEPPAAATAPPPDATASTVAPDPVTSAIPAPMLDQPVVQLPVQDTEAAAMLPAPSEPVERPSSPNVVAQPVPASPPPVPRQQPDPAQVRRDKARLAQENARRREVTEARAVARQQAAETRDKRRAAQAVVAGARQQDGGGQSQQQAAPSSDASGASVATWRGEVMARLNAAKPAAPNGATGTVRVAFSVDRNGRILSTSLAVPVRFH